MYNKSNICKAANELAKRGYSKSEAFRKAWELAKNVISKVAGVSFGKRPAALERLTHYKPEQIIVKLERETYNSFDGNAIAVIVAVEGKGSYCVGYVPSAISKIAASSKEYFDIKRRQIQPFISMVKIVSTFNCCIPR